MCMGSRPSTPTAPKVMVAPPPPAPAPPPPPAPAPKPIQEPGAKPSLRIGSSKASETRRKKTTAGSLRTGLNINTGGEGGLNV
jgi:hypothetical protein